MPSMDSHQLVIALEPECASLYCRRLKCAEFINEPEEDTIAFVPGTKYLVIDCGGKNFRILVINLATQIYSFVYTTYF